jgi:hypothetical protein
MICCKEFNILSNVKENDPLIKWFGDCEFTIINEITLPTLLKQIGIFETTSQARAAGFVKFDRGFSEIKFKKKQVHIYILHDPFD